MTGARPDAVTGTRPDGTLDQARLDVTLDWLRQGTARCRRLVASLTDADAAAASGLPGWSRAHLVTHLARNADALVNLLTWARTGVPTPMYTSTRQRAADIAAGAGRSARQVRADLSGAEERLAAAIGAMTRQDWLARVRTAQGREVAAAQVPWLRVREVWVHAIDLTPCAGDPPAEPASQGVDVPADPAPGCRVADLPADLVDALLDEVTASFTARHPEFALRLRATDRDRHWRIGGATTGTAVDGGGAATGVTGPDRPEELAGTAPELLGWLIGRAPVGRLTPRPAGAVPLRPPPWL